MAGAYVPRSPARLVSAAPVEVRAERATCGAFDAQFAFPVAAEPVARAARAHVTARRWAGDGLPDDLNTAVGVLCSWLPKSAPIGIVTV
jgi:hypothetical protein